VTIEKVPRSVKIWFGIFEVRFAAGRRNKKSGQQTPRRWRWGTALKKRAATRIKELLHSRNFLSTGRPGPHLKPLRWEFFP
jgi:hypothetical protein